jgi:hypothetical protein
MCLMPRFVNIVREIHLLSKIGQNQTATGD